MIRSANHEHSVITPFAIASVDFQLIYYIYDLYISMDILYLNLLCLFDLFCILLCYGFETELWSVISLFPLFPHSLPWLQDLGSRFTDALQSVVLFSG